MYVPPSFAVSDPARLAQFMADHSFAVVCTQHEGVPFASHVPLLYQPDAASYGTLCGHFARANPQWKAAVGESNGIPVLAIFSGPHTYISPTWYAEPNTVPTWNYVAVHATGRLRLIEDPNCLLELIRQTVNVYEAPQPQPWRLEAQNTAFVDKLLGGIVGFEITIDQLEGKWKLNQNHPAERRERVIEVLANSPRHDDQQVAALMREV
ncbi:FMN-binding negative transcriptional regulator [Anatilimnocola sp. NA78]|uniref:FMN-binding negative transcriptional regulator n=1 Tax=Anatilimnocola sp. NA78 TaxID=3415683 RepID=UPI003CE567BE